MPKTVLTVTLNPALDSMITMRKSILPRKLLSVKEIQSAGGKGFNVSRALACLKVPTVAMGLVGGKVGKQMQKLLKDEKFKSRITPIDGETRTISRTIDLKGKAHNIGTGVGPNLKARELKAFRQRYEKSLRRSGIIVLSGRIAPGADENIYSRLIRLAHKHKRNVIVDTSGAPLVDSLKAKPWMVKINRKEAQEAYGRELSTMSDIKRAINHFHSYGCEYVLITLGAKGVVGSNQKEILWAKPPSVKGINELGAGDSLLAGWIWSWQQNRDFGYTLEAAAAAGTASLHTFIPGLIRKRNLLQLLKQITLTSV